MQPKFHLLSIRRNWLKKLTKGTIRVRGYITAMQLWYTAQKKSKKLSFYVACKWRQQIAKMTVQNISPYWNECLIYLVWVFQISASIKAGTGSADRRGQHVNSTPTSSDCTLIFREKRSKTFFLVRLLQKKSWSRWNSEMLEEVCETLI